jgi:hypothetical protein
MVQYGMPPVAVLQADLINGGKLLGWDGQMWESSTTQRGNCWLQWG